MLIVFKVFYQATPHPYWASPQPYLVTTHPYWVGSSKKPIVNILLCFRYYKIVVHGACTYCICTLRQFCKWNSVLGSGYSRTCQPLSGALLTVLPFPAPSNTLALFSVRVCPYLPILTTCFLPLVICRNSCKTRFSDRLATVHASCNVIIFGVLGLIN